MKNVAKLTKKQKEFLKLKNKELGTMLDLGLHGHFEEAEKIGSKWIGIESEEPHFSFNMGFYEARNGNLLKSHIMLHKGRNINVFGNQYPFKYQVPIWDGITNNKFILLYLEGGLGDQIIYARFAKDIAARGNKVAICCDPRLIPILKDIEGVSAIVPFEGINYIYCDVCVPAMSVIGILGYEYKDLSNKPYLKREIFHNSNEPHQFTIGLKWSGNPKYAHEQHRKFDFKYVLDLIEPFKDKVKFISLQRDEECELKPDWVECVNLETFEDTRKAICSCDMVLSSCTSVAHFAAAMGIDTRIIIPLLSYHIWALPGDISPYYESVRLYRQEQYETWNEPFFKLKCDLEKILIPQHFSQSI